MKILSFCSSEDTVKRIKREDLEWEKILMDHISDKGYVFRIHNSPNSRLRGGGP